MAEVTVQLEGTEEEAVERMVRAGLFANRDEAVRAAILKYAFDLGLLRREDLWAKITQARQRGVSPDQLKADLERLEDEA
jgi:Arc/MetJ-type ribon-helix-helix transcriptional regulator